MSDVIYSIEALSTGAGRDGHVTTEGGRLDLDVAVPVAMGGWVRGRTPKNPSPPATRRASVRRSTITVSDD